MDNNRKLENTSNLYQMFDLALQIDDLECEKDLQKHEVSGVFISEEDNNFGNPELSSYSVPSTAEILNENPRDYQLCLTAMNHFDPEYNRDFNSIFVNIEEFKDGKIYFERKRALKNFDGKSYHLKFIPNRYPTRACLFAVKKVNQKISPYFGNFEGFQFAVNRRIRQFPLEDFEWKNKDVVTNEEQKQAIRQIVNCSAYPSPYVSFNEVLVKFFN